jgi:hypothetical protein
MIYTGIRKTRKRYLCSTNMNPYVCVLYMHMHIYKAYEYVNM